MALTQLASPYPVFTDKNGDPLDAGFLYFGEPNENPEAKPITVYYDRGFTQPAAQPIRTSNGYVMRNGAPALIYADGQFSITVRNKNSELVIYSPVGYGVTPGIPFAAFEYAVRDVAALLADTNFTYAAGVPGKVQVAAGDILRTLAEGFAYEVEPVVFVGPHVATASGVKLKLLPDEEGFLSTEQMGLALDNSTDDSAALTSLADACRAGGYGMLSPVGKTVYLASAVDLRSIPYFKFRSKIRVNPAIVGVPVTLGGYAITAITSNFVFDDITDGTQPNTDPAPSRPIVRLWGAKATKMEIGRCNYFQIYADSAVSSGSSNSYICIDFIGQCRRFECTDSGSGVNWVNEIVTWGGRFKEIAVIGVVYRHNHYQINDASLEGGGVEIDLQNAANIWINGVRADKVNGEEGAASTISFDANTYSCQVEVTWSGTGAAGEEFNAPFANITDLGQGNSVHRKIATTYRKTTVFSLPGDLLIGNSSACVSSNPAIGAGRFPYEPANLIPSLAGFQPPAFRTIALSPMIPVTLGSVFGFDADYDGSHLRAFVMIFDEDMAPLTAEGGGGEFISFSGLTGPNTTDGFGFYSHASNQPVGNIRRYGTVIRSDVAYIRFGVFSGTTNPVIRHLSGHVWTPPTFKGNVEGAARGFSIGMSLNGSPTRGYAPLGTTLWNTSGTPAIIRVSYAHETILNGALAAGATSVTVTDIDTVANGDVVGIPLDNGATHWSAVSSLSGGTFTIAAIPSGRAAVNKARVVFNRWS